MLCRLCQRFYIARGQKEWGKIKQKSISIPIPTNFHELFFQFSQKKPGLMCIELYGKIFENESTDIATFSGVSNFSQWKCHGHGTKGWKIINWKQNIASSKKFSITKKVEGGLMMSNKDVFISSKISTSPFVTKLRFQSLKRYWGKSLIDSELFNWFWTVGSQKSKKAKYVLMFAFYSLKKFKIIFF